MILLSKKENEMTKEDFLKLEIMKTIAVAKGYDLKNEKFDLDFRQGSAFEKAARFLMVKFDISQKKLKFDLSEKKDITVGAAGKVLDSEEKNGVKVIKKIELNHVSVNKTSKKQLKSKKG